MTNIETLKDALPHLNPGDRNFAQSLITQSAKKALSDKQLFWVDKLAARAAAGPKTVETVKVAATFAGVLHLFATASAHLKRPRIRLALDCGAEVQLSLAPKTGSNAGFVYVKIDHTYVGKISPAGEFSPFKLEDTLRDQLLGLLAALGNDPAGVAAAYGKLTGSCCFCSITLTDERSTAVGYGPICADHYGLPWGEAH